MRKIMKVDARRHPDLRHKRVHGVLVERRHPPPSHSQTSTLLRKSSANGWLPN